MKEREIEDLTSEERKEIGDHYAKQFEDVFQPLARLFKDILKSKDTLALLFCIEVTQGLLSHVVKRFEDADDTPDTVHGWPVGGIGDTVGEA